MYTMLRYICSLPLGPRRLCTWAPCAVRRRHTRVRAHVGASGDEGPLLEAQAPSHRIASHCIVLHPYASVRISSYCIASHLIVLHRIASDRISSHLIASVEGYDWYDRFLHGLMGCLGYDDATCDAMAGCSRAWPKPRTSTSFGLLPS